MNEKKTGLALGGGGSRGSYEVGVCQALDEMGYHFDIVTGTSIGAICGAVYVQNEVNSLKEWIASLTQSSVAANLFMFPDQYNIEPDYGKSINVFIEQFSQNGPSIEPLKLKLAEVFDYDKFSQSSIDFGCISYNVTQGQEQTFRKSDMTKEDALEKILSSTAYFPAFNMVQIGQDYYLDGGYCLLKPYELALSMGAQAVITVFLKNYSDPVQIPQDPSVTSILPILNLMYYLDFNGQALSRQVSQGYLETLKYFSKAPGYLYTFYPEDWKHMQHLEELVMGILVKTGKISLLEEIKPAMDKIYKFLLGYIPRPLKNDYSDQFIFGRVLECLGLIAGIDLYTQIHFKDFIHEILSKFQHMNSNPNTLPSWEIFNEMEKKGLQDLMVFFHTALKSYDGTLPEEFEVFKRKFLFPYYLGWGWYIMEKVQIIFYL